VRILRDYTVAPLPSYKCCPLKGDRLLVTTWAIVPLVKHPSVTTYLSGIFEEVETRVPGVKALSFADDISWWAEDKNEKEVVEELAEASKAAVSWGEENGIAFDHSKSEAVLFS